jgi:hypothetical protein
MRHAIILLAAGLTMLISSAAYANKQDRAIHECKQSIRDAYGVSNFRNVFAERIGHNRFRVYGKILNRGRSYPFSCGVKRGRVQSYNYDGPHRKYDDEYYNDSRHDNKARNVAIGVGLAALAAAAIAASSKNQTTAPAESFSYNDGIDKSHLEDECGEELGGRIRREHDGVRRIEFDHSQIKHNGSQLTGSGHIQWQREEPSALEFSCSFDRNGRVSDSSYSFY